MASNVSFHFEVAAWTPESSALEFIGAFDKGTKITVITKEGVGYTYSLGSGACIDRNSLQNILRVSVGKYWVLRLKPNGELVDKDTGASNWTITADDFITEPAEVAMNPISQWEFNGDGLFCF